MLNVFYNCYFARYVSKLSPVWIDIDHLYEESKFKLMPKNKHNRLDSDFKSASTISSQNSARDIQVATNCYRVCLNS
jgi:hypothetical protein